ncbi:MAG: methionyl-tRNA formyltransferase [SAR202 cluster bacterium]|jgi:methionyl-tRNA formyltransferase|nr:methionyl-tRNA formyltransferase [SAR202 cluster bacterium]MDP6512070.1 methionyl-tRNA formyltransferase [SAR202 cluster bacterium]MDP6715295.1 methionyl-tRNA formyltransferase [SAR202 cluster bacterium]
MDRRKPEDTRIVFMGTPDIALPVLDALIIQGYQMVGVYTRRDRRAGRGRQMAASPIKTLAIERGIPVFQPASLRTDKAAQAELAALKPDVIVVAAYGLFLPVEVLELPPFGCLNIHPSLLPRHRGPSPVATAILDGDVQTGVSLMKLDEGMDSGPILAQRDAAIGDQENTEDLTERLFEMGASLLIETLPKWIDGTITANPQDDSQVTVSGLLERADGEIDWSRPADEIARKVRAFHPWPGTFTTWNGKSLKVIDALSSSGSPSGATPGDVVRADDAQPAIVTGNGTLILKRIQLEGRKPVTASEFVQGYQDFIGSHLES